VIEVVAPEVLADRKKESPDGSNNVANLDFIYPAYRAGVAPESVAEIESDTALLGVSDSRGGVSFEAPSGVKQTSLRLRWQMLKRALSLPVSLHRARRGRHQSPRMLTHTVTFGCNARCVMCDSWQLPVAGDLSLNEIADIYRQLPHMDVVRLTGGEPFVRPDLPEIAALAIEHLRPGLLHISSNGFLSDRIVRFCQQRERSVPLELVLSIDGVGGFHNDIRGHNGAWRLVWKTLSALAPLQSELNLRLVVNQTVANNEGLIEYDRLHQLLLPMGIEHHLNLAYAESATYSLERGRAIEQSESQGFDSYAQFDKHVLDNALTSALQRARKLPWHRKKARQYYLHGLRQRVGQHPQKLNPTCQALHTHVRLFPNGDVPVCQFNSTAVGNVRRQSFAEIWNSDAATKHRKWVRGCTGCWAECEVMPSAVYSMDLVRYALLDGLPLPGSRVRSRT
jgi:MoaA/NifB/PqqE/SkfB family radical SAM enzyme